MLDKPNEIQTARRGNFTNKLIEMFIYTFFSESTLVNSKYTLRL